MSRHLHLCFLFLLVTAAIHAQTVDFTYTTTAGTFCSPQTVTFTQNCTGSPGGFIWNFGNGQSNVHSTDTARYTGPGNYTVTLTALYADVAIVNTKVITIHPTPTISLSANTNSICQPGNITFTAAGSSSLAVYEWTFGDGTPSQTTAVNTITHNFADYGAYTVQVKGITAAGCFAVSSFTAEVKRFTLDGHLNPEKGCIPMTTFLFVNDDIPTGDAPQSYLWDFGDGTPLFTGTTYFTNHIYNVTTPVTPHVTVTSTQGCVATFDFTEVAYGTPPINLDAGTKSHRDTFCGNEFIIMRSKAPLADEYVWNFGDGSIELPVQDTLVYYKYADTGSYRVVVTPMFHGCPGPKDSFDIYVEGVIAKFSFGNTCSNRNVFSFANNSSGHVSHFEWTFTNTPGLIDSVNYNVTHSFPVSGIYNTQLLLYDSLSACADTLIQTVFTAQPQISASTELLCRDSAIVYTVSNTYPPAAGIAYTFHADGNIIYNGLDSVLIHYALNHGSYDDYVILQSPNLHICHDTIELPVPTLVAGPVTSISATERVCLNVPVVVTNLTHPYFPADTIVQWQWDYWDGHTSNLQFPPPYLYSSPGEYLLSLTATDINGCALKKTVTVIADPIPQLTVYPRFDTICLARDSVELTAYTIDPFTWNPSPDITCNTCDTIKVSPAASTYYVAHASNAGGCHTYDTSFVKVYTPFNLNVFPADTAGCAGLTVQYRLNQTGITVWSPATGLSGTSIPNPVATTSASITYQVIVKDTASCYADTALAKITIYPTPTVDAGPDRILPYNSPFTLAPAYGPAIQSYSWTPATNLSCSNCAMPTGITDQSTVYKITVVSDKGCKASDEVKILIACEKSSLWLPNAFTPFNGGANNNFYPMARGYKSIKSFTIFNRLGNKIFERKDFLPNIPSLGWNGNIKADIRGQGTQSFVWLMEAVCEQGTIVNLSGSVLLIR